MANAGLLLVGVVLLINGLVILAVVPPRSAALLNIFVGSAQVILPTIILIQNADDPAVVNGTWPSYLFGITYLYYGLGIFLDLEPEGLGWFSAFVAAIALFKGVLAVGTDPVFAVVWLSWAVLWSLFFALMALGRERLARFTGWFLVWAGVPSCVAPALFLLEGHWTLAPVAGWLTLGYLVLAGVASWALGRSGVPRAGTAEPSVEPSADPGAAAPAARLQGPPVPA